MNEELKEEDVIEKKGSYLKKILFLFLLLLILFYLYIRFGEPNLLVVHEYPVVDLELPSNFDGLKIVHFSDLLYGSTIHENNLKKIVKKINSLNPDIVIYTGDLFNDSVRLNEKNYEVIINELKNITSTFRKYAVIGNFDASFKEDYIRIMENSGFTILDNSYDFLYYGGNEPLLFMGTSSLLANNNDISSFYSLENVNHYYKIWINHEPQIMDELLESPFTPNIILTGHTLGGLINLPFHGYLLKQNGIENYMADYYEEDDMKMYISSGLGTYKYNVRLANVPSINFYRFYKE